MSCWNCNCDKCIAAKKYTYESAIKNAQQIKRNSEFVNSCARYYEKNGLLTSKQLTALLNIQRDSHRNVDSLEYYDKPQRKSIKTYNNTQKDDYEYKDGDSYGDW
jgi:hypothetical protein